MMTCGPHDNSINIKQSVRQDFGSGLDLQMAHRCENHGDQEEADGEKYRERPDDGHLQGTT